MHPAADNAALFAWVTTAFIPLFWAGECTRGCNDPAARNYDPVKRPMKSPYAN